MMNHWQDLLRAEKIHNIVFVTVIVILLVIIVGLGVVTYVGQFS